jgi:ubiquinone/menaquinone biosynthesis C-methylase UbiE
MNRFENWFCGSAFWRSVTERKILPWMLSGYKLGDEVLELGAGLGASTDELRRLAARVTSLEYDHGFAARLGLRFHNSNVHVLQGDAAELPFPDGAFSSVLAVLMLHHLKSQEQQEKAFKEIYRVLQAGGVFLAMEIGDGWLQRFGHIKSTFVPVAPNAAFAQLKAIGFSKIIVDIHHAAFRICAERCA